MEYTVSSVISLISHIHSQTADFTSKKLSTLGNFVSSHGFILYLLSEQEKLTMGEIAQMINRDKSTTTVLIRKLRDEGLVEQTCSLTDSRVKYISLTEKGRQFNQTTSAISKDLLTACYKNFTPIEQETLLHLLSKMSANLDESMEDKN